LPLSPAARAIVEGDPGIRARLAAAGDDYELLFAAPADAAETIATLSLRFGVPVTRIGRIDVGAGVRLLGADGHQIPLEDTGYRHF
jgi:thiamine-monophosphate kinase